MASAESGSVPNSEGYGEGCPLSSRLGGLGERCELPQRGPWQSPGQKRVLGYFEGHRTLFFVPTIYEKNLRGTICISVPLLRIKQQQLVNTECLIIKMCF